MKSYLLNTGKAALTRALKTGKRLSVCQFRVGTAANFEVDRNAVDPAPSVVYTGGADCIDVTMLNGDQIRYILLFRETVGPFRIGNIVLYLQEEGNPDPIPYVQGINPVAVPKYRDDPPSSIGNRLLFNITGQYANIADAVNLTITTPAFANLPTYVNETELPAPELAVFQHCVLLNHTRTGRPALAVRRVIDNHWFGIGVMQPIKDANFGVIDGGIVGDGYVDSFVEKVEGGSFTTNVFDTIIDDGNGSWILGDDYETLDGGSFVDTFVGDGGVSG